MSEAGESYGKTLGGRLTLKGGLELKRSEKHKKHKKHKKKHKKDDTSEPSSEQRRGAAEEQPPVLEIQNGSGRISSSGTTVHGHEGSQFMKEMRAGDAIIITHPTTLTDETRIVKMVLSDVSLSISSPFTSDLISTVTFRYVNAPREEINEEEESQKKRQKLVDNEKEAFGTYAGDLGSKFVYRVKRAGAYGGYRIVEEDTSDKSRTELLEMRANKKADRFCM